MTLGLKRGCVKLMPHQEEWHAIAQDTIKILLDILGGSAVDIQHIGSTAIKNIEAKPIIDIAVGVRRFEDIEPYITVLEENGIIFRGGDNDGQLFVIGDFENDTRSHHIHVVLYNSKAWNDYIKFRDYLNEYPEKAKEYECLKQFLASEYPNDRVAYTESKHEFISNILIQ